MLKKLFGLALVFALAVGATLLYLDRSPDAPGSRPGAAAGTPSRPAVLLGEAPSGSEIRLSESDLRELVRTALADDEKGRRALELAKELRTEIDDGRIEVGLVLNLSELDPEQLTEEEREAVEKVSRYLSFLGDKDLYVAVNGVPVARDGMIAVERDLKIKLAFLSLPIDEMGDLLGFEVEELRDGLTLDLSPFKARQVLVLEDEVVVSLGTGA